MAAAIAQVEIDLFVRQRVEIPRGVSKKTKRKPRFGMAKKAAICAHFQSARTGYPAVKIAKRLLKERVMAWKSHRHQFCY